MTSIPWAIFGVILVIFGFSGYSWATFTIFVMPLVCLIVFELLRKAFFCRTGENPCITSVTSVIGGRPLPGLFSKPPGKKRITLWDFGFSFAQALIPMAILGTFANWANSDIRHAGISSNHAQYPAVWFAAVNDPNKPSWEILPQDAKPGEVILSKRNELGILSNFAATPFELYGKRYASVEGFWQMMLYPEGASDERAKEKSTEWKVTREQVARMSAFEAKSAGTLAEENMKRLGIDWCTFEGKRFLYRSATPGEHYRLIVAAMRAKLEQNPEVKRILLATGDLILKPDHQGEIDPPPEWKYHEIWMQMRTELASRPRRR